MNCPTCNLAIDKHPAGRCLDAWVAESVMGECAHIWTLKHTEPEYCRECGEQIGGWDGGDYPTKVCEKCGKEVQGLAFSVNGACHSKPYSTEISAAWKAVEKTGLFEANLLWRDGQDWHILAHEYLALEIARAPTVSLAICRAALRAVMEDNPA